MYKRLEIYPGSLPSCPKLSSVYMLGSIRGWPPPLWMKGPSEGRWLKYKGCHNTKWPVSFLLMGSMKTGIHWMPYYHVSSYLPSSDGLRLQCCWIQPGQGLVMVWGSQRRHSPVEIHKTGITNYFLAVTPNPNDTPGCNWKLWYQLQSTLVSNNQTDCITFSCAFSPRLYLSCCHSKGFLLTLEAWTFVYASSCTDCDWPKHKVKIRDPPIKGPKTI